MPEYQLIIGNKTYSSWSLRPWLLLAHLGQPFQETLIPLRQADTKQKILEQCSAGKVPILKTPRVMIWDSLSICEFINEKFPGALLWPRDPSQRAFARSIVAEMHSGFPDLRNELPMNLRRISRPRRTELSDNAKAQVQRVLNIWQECRTKHGPNGAMLFGKFSIADAFYAPVVTRFLSYAIPMPPECEAYAQAVRQLPVMDRWYREAEKEQWVLPEIDEI